MTRKIFILLLFIFSFSFGAYFRNSLKPVSGQNNRIEFWINPGDGINEVAEVLETTGAIHSKFFFKVYGILTSRAFLLQPGVHYISGGQSVPEILSKLSSGPDEINIVVFPGMTMKEIEEKLTISKIISSGELVNFNPAPFKKRYSFLANAVSLEGFLMPDTYKFLPYSEINNVVAKFLDNFQNKVNGLKDAKGLTFLLRNDILQKLVIASLLEKEIPDADERRIAAGILEKRLKNDVPLQIDATIFYFKCEGKFVGCDNVVRSDYKKASPFNTYLNKGLPPAPISNPSAQAISAALNPAASTYWYYLSDPITKKTIFSSTFDEHNKNRYRYLKM